MSEDAGAAGQGNPEGGGNEGASGAQGGSGTQGNPAGSGAPAGSAPENSQVLNGRTYDMTVLEDVKAYNADLKVINRKLEAEGKAGRAAAKKLQDLEDSQKSELERERDRANRAEAAQRAGESQTARLLAVAAHSLHPDLIDLLGDGTAEEVNDRAENIARIVNESAAAAAQEIITAELAKYGIQYGQEVQNGNGSRNGFQTAAGAARNGSGRPVESLRPGAMPASESGPRSASDLFRGMISNR
jgi:hypothetical protein